MRCWSATAWGMSGPTNREHGSASRDPVFYRLHRKMRLPSTMQSGLEIVRIREAANESLAKKGGMVYL
jgi:hypothetical protein